MRFDIVNLHFLRYPYGDEAMMGVLKIVAIADNSRLINTLISCMDQEEISIDVLKPYDNIAEHFRIYHPDVLMLSTDSLDMDYFMDLTRDLQAGAGFLPMLINIAAHRDSDIDAITNKYQGYYYIRPPFSPKDQAKHVQTFLLTKVVTKEFYLQKIHRCIELTLMAMKCDPDSAGFELLISAVDKIMLHPYCRFNFYRDIYPQIGERYGISAQTVDNRIKATIADALKNMTDYEKQIAFDIYTLPKGVPTTPEFIHSAAYITSKPCKRILRNLEDEPFFMPDKRYTIF